MARNCCACQNTPQPDSCRVSITGADLVEQLLYYQGLDENLCTKFMEYVPFIDCAGNPITPGAAIVTCPEFEEQLCEIISTLASGGEVVLGVTEVVGADCQVYVIPETPLVATDSTSIDFTTSGPFGHNITGVVRISAAPDNSIIILPDGLYVPTACEQLSGALAGDPVVLGVTGLLGTDCLTHVVPETPITVVDSITVDLTSSGAFGHTLEADVNVSAVVGNQLVIQPDGLYVPPAVVTDVCDEIQDFPVGAPGVPGVTQFVGADCVLHALPAGSDTIIAVTDGDCIDLSVVEGPPDTWTISADLAISPNDGNSLSCVGNGLFSAEVSISAEDSDCIDITIQNPSEGEFIIGADPIIAPIAGNVLQCVPQGLFVPAAAAGDPVVLTALDSDCIDVGVIVNAANDFTVTADIILGDAYPGFPAGSNPALCGLDGLVVPPPSTAAVSAARFAGPGPFAVPIGGPTTIGALGVTVNNPSAFRSAIVIVSMAHPALSMVATAAGDDSVILESQIEFLLPGFVTPFQRFAISALSGLAPNSAGIAFAMDGNGSTFHLTQAECLIPPGGAATINARLLYTNNGATTPIITIGDYGISLTLITI